MKKKKMFLLNKQFDINLLSNTDDCYNRHLLSLNCENYIANDERVYTSFLLEYYKSFYLDKTYYNSCAIFEKEHDLLIIYEYTTRQYYDVEELKLKVVNEINLKRTKKINCFGKVFIDTLEKYRQLLDIENYQYHLFINI